MHKNTKLLPYERKDIFRRWGMGTRITVLAKEYKVTRQTIYDTVKDARLGIFHNRSSMNQRYRNIYYGLRRLAKVQAKLQEKILRQEKRKRRYERATPGELVHLDTKRLPLLRGEAVVQPRECLFVAIDDYSRWIFADMFPDKTSYSAAIFLEEVKKKFPFKLQCLYSDNGSEYKGRKSIHPVSVFCEENKLDHKFTKPAHPWTNGKAERLIRTLITEWHSKSTSNFISRDHRRRYLYAFCDWYNQSRNHSSINSSPLQRLESYYEELKREKCLQRLT